MERDSAARNSRTPVFPTALDRGLDVLESVLAESPETGLGAIASSTGLPKPTVHRILGVLVRRGYAATAGHGRYGPGAQVFTSAGLAQEAWDYSRVARPLLEELRSNTCDTIHLGRRLGDEAVYVDKWEGSRPFQMTSGIGMRLPLHCTAIGKAILAFAADRDQLLSRLRLDDRARRTITDLGDLVVELDSVRRRKFALDNEENEDGVLCVGAPVFDYRGVVVGAISVSAPAFSFKEEDARALAPLIIEAADEVSLALGAPRALLLNSPREPSLAACAP